MIECKLASSKRQTAFGPLCLLGHYLAKERVLEPLSSVRIAQKTVRYSPTQKLTDALMGILAGCKAIYQTNVRVRPNLPLCEAFGRRDGCAEQSTIQRTLDAFTDENLGWLCLRGYHFVAKGYHGGRAKKLAKSVAEDAWHEGPTPGQLLAIVAPEEAPRYSRPSRTVARRWTDEKGLPYSDYLITTLTELSAPEVAKLYDRRGGMESDIKGDKRGLGIEQRRKKSFCAQEALALLAQLAHNILAWFKGWFLRGTAAAELGAQRLVRDVLAMPAEARVGRFSGVLRLRLPRLHPWAEAVAAGTRARSIRDGRRTFWRKN